MSILCLSVNFDNVKRIEVITSGFINKDGFANKVRVQGLSL